MSLLLLAYAFLASKRYSHLFVPLDVIASLLLTIHAIMIKDPPFAVVNGFITGMLILRLLRTGVKKL